MEVNSSRHIQALPVAQKNVLPAKSVDRTGLHPRRRDEVFEESLIRSAKPTKHYSRYEKGSIVDIFA